MKDNNKAVKIIKSLTDLVGVTAGIILASIGAIMFLNAVFNLYVFNINMPEYDYGLEYKCEAFDVDKIEARRLIGVGGKGPVLVQEAVVQEQTKKVADLTDEQKEKLRKQYNDCVAKTKKENELKFEMGEKRHIATGLAFMIVGFPLIFFYQRKKRAA